MQNQANQAMNTARKVASGRKGSQQQRFVMADAKLLAPVYGLPCGSSKSYPLLFNHHYGRMQVDGRFVNVVDHVAIGDGDCSAPHSCSATAAHRISPQSAERLIGDEKRTARLLAVRGIRVAHALDAGIDGVVRIRKGCSLENRGRIVQALVRAVEVIAGDVEIRKRRRGRGGGGLELKLPGLRGRVGA